MNESYTKFEYLVKGEKFSTTVKTNSALMFNEVVRKLQLIADHGSIHATSLS